jgi:plasmid replication initiation protein
MQKLHKSKTPKVYKNKKLNNANFGTYNLNDYQVFLQIISKLGKVDINGTYGQPQDLEREYTLTAKEFSQAFGVDLNTSYGVLKRASNRLARTAITLEKPELFEIWDIPVCEISQYNTKEGSITVTFNIHIMPYLAQVKSKFVLYNLKEIANFGSLYSTRLYELIQEFKDTGYIIKSVAQLREVFAVGKKFKLYADFKRYTFAHAVGEINAQYELNLRFEELKEGRKVVAIRFEFTPSRTSQGYNPATKQLVNTIVKPKRKIKQTDDHTPQPVHPNQQELPNIDVKNPKTTTGKILKIIGAEPEWIESAELKEGVKGIVVASKKVVNRRVTKAKAIVEKSASDVKAIINALMEEEGLTETQATIKAIKLKLI